MTQAHTATDTSRRQSVRGRARMTKMRPNVEIAPAKIAPALARWDVEMETTDWLKGRWVVTTL